MTDDYRDVSPRFSQQAWGFLSDATRPIVG
ncbi:MAG: hypothetical protein RLZZ597_3260 [Cyanobacteriota bacterium]|jgi:hypothetical protein